MAPLLFEISSWDDPQLVKVNPGVAYGIGVAATGYLMHLYCDKLLPGDIDELLRRIKNLLEKVAASLGEAVQALAKIIIDEQPDAQGQRVTYCEVELNVATTEELEKNHKKLKLELEGLEKEWDVTKKQWIWCQPKLRRDLRERLLNLGTRGDDLSETVWRSSSAIRKKEQELHPPADLSRYRASP
ncbi:hypothetical protein PsYK624_087050 [Phanerochaete sordida]|uniref:Uncharacterized protein n=1 Tax=Phanerochaete sordida TaxID=48140 RepID=A0A9P3GF01_9APHY|nr:hypothetical protein PsYK624_087050 [Phanerochaete sordida]